MRRQIAIVVATGALLAALVGSPATSAVVVKAVSCSTCTSGYKWMPKSVSIARGVTVTWKSVNGFHDLKSISSNWSKSSGLPTSYTFTRTGTFRYRCTYHSTYNRTTGRCTGMCGRVVVG